MNVPDYIDPFVGVRVWNVSCSWENQYPYVACKIEGPLLTGIAYIFPWPAKKPMTAMPWRCWGYGGYSYSGDYPDRYNTAGCYAYRSYWQFFWHSSYSIGKNNVIGECYLWGRIVEHQHGYRSEFAYPKRLIGTKKAVRSMAALYGIPYVSWPRYIAERLYGTVRRSGPRIYRGTLALASSLRRASARRGTNLDASRDA